MVSLKFSRPDFEYDVQGLVNSFFPVIKEEPDPNLSIEIEYLEDSINIHFQEKEQVRSENISVNYQDRKETKNRLKRQLYTMLSQYTGLSLPWGTLSGIRPTKIPVALLEEGMDQESVEEYMKKIYLVSEEKIALSIEVAKRELELLKHIDYANGYSLYIGIPFCPSTCSYCSFTSYSITKYEDLVDKYLEALFKEIEFFAEYYNHKKLNTVYIGGGTPTSLTHIQLNQLLNKITSTFDLTHCMEFTVEAGRPDSITKEKLEVLRKYPVDRISINPQTMKEETLGLIGRKHTVEDVYKAFNLARSCGFTNINMDLIIGLPDESFEDVKNTLEQILSLHPDCITIHSLAIKRAAAMNTDKNKFKNYSVVNNEEIMNLTAGYAKKMNLEPYYLYRQKNMAGNMENVGYASEGKASIYNILIMEEKQTILALGAGAITKVVFEEGRIERVSNVKNVEHYIDRIEEMINRKSNVM